MEESVATRRKARRYLVITSVLALWGLITHGTYAGTGDEPHYAMIAHSIAFDRDLDVANDYADPHNLIFGATLEPGGHALPGKDGTLRPVHDIGLPLVFAPYFAVSYWFAEQAGTHLPATWLRRAKLNQTVILRHLLSFGTIALTVWIALQLCSVFEELSGRSRRAAAWAALFVLSPPLLSHSYLFFTEILSAALTLWTVRALTRPDSVIGTAALAGATTGFLLLVHTRNIGLVAGLGIIAVWRWYKRDPRALAVFVSCAAIAFAIRAAVLFHFWGTFVTTPIAALGSSTGISDWFTIIATRLAGWLLDPEHGLLPYAPIYALLPFGWSALLRRNRSLCTALSVVVVIYVAAMAVPTLNPIGWRGGWSPAARFLVPVVPLLAVPAFTTVAARPKIGLLVGLLVAVQIAIDGFFWQHPKLLWNDGDGVTAVALYFAGRPLP